MQDGEAETDGMSRGGRIKLEGGGGAGGSAGAGAGAGEAVGQKST